MFEGSYISDPSGIKTWVYAMYNLTSKKYGKDEIRVYKVHRDASTGVHEVYDMTLTVMLEGDIDISYKNLLRNYIPHSKSSP